MSTELYNSLFDKNASHSGPEALVAAFAQLGRVHRAAADLAADEMAEGMWVHEEEAPAERMRFAADDRDELQASYSGGAYVLEVSLSESGWTAVQTAGPAGASLKIAGEWVVLTPGEAASLPIDGLVETLTLVDLVGTEIQLSR